MMSIKTAIQRNGKFGMNRSLLEDDICIFGVTNGPSLHLLIKDILYYEKKIS